MLLGDTFAISGALAIGLGAILSKFLTSKMQPVPIQAVRGLSGGIILVFIVILMGDAGQYAQLSPRILTLSLLAGLCGITLGDALYMKILSMAPASKACPVLWSLRILFVAIGSVIFYQEAISWIVGLAAVIIIGGVYLALSAEEAPELKARTGGGKNSWLPLALIAGILWAAYYLIIKLVLVAADPIVVNSLNSTVASVVLFLFLIFTGRGESLKVHQAGMRNFGVLIANGILVYVIGMVLELYAIGLAGAVRTAILVSWVPIFVLILSAFFLKEKMTWRLVLGTFSCIGGTILLVTS